MTKYRKKPVVMPQCKMNYCKEPAVYNRRWGHKRYCEAHGNAYADKRDKALAARAKMQDCQSGISPSCEGKVSVSRQEHGHTTCRWCEEEQREQLRRQAHLRRKHEQIEKANTVEELKRWIQEFML